MCLWKVVKFKQSIIKLNRFLQAHLHQAFFTQFYSLIDFINAAYFARIFAALGAATAKQ